MPALFTVKMQGFDLLKEQTEDLTRGQFIGAIAKTMDKASEPLLDTMRSGAPSYTGTLKLSLDKKIKRYPKNGTVIAVIGPNSKVRVVNAKGKPRKPAHYAHLVEKGHKIVTGGKAALTVTKRNGKQYHYKGTGGKVVGFVPGKHFMADAEMATRSLFEMRMEYGLRDNVIQAAERARRKAEKKVKTK